MLSPTRLWKNKHCKLRRAIALFREIVASNLLFKTFEYSGRVMRQGQKYDVEVVRIVLKGPNGERTLDDWILERNLDPNVLQAATSNFD